MRLNPDQYAAINRLLGSADGQTLQAIFINQLDDTYRALTSERDAAQMHVLQGQAQMLQDVLQAFHDAPTLRTPRTERGPMI